MRFHEIKELDVANGEGIRVSIWFQGCDIRCPHCFNKKLWDVSQGKTFTISDYLILEKQLKKPYIKGLSILGGEPLLQDDIVDFCRKIKSQFPNKDIWLFSGHTFREIEHSSKSKLLQYIDVLVDGPFKQELKNLKLKFRGSSNQHIYRKIEGTSTWVIDPYEE